MEILSLPVELLVFIVSFLVLVKDKVKLRYVSRRFRRISETPSLWRKFVWHSYDFREERCLHNLFKICGNHIVRLSFPDHVMASKLVKFLQHCGNVRHLSLPQETKLSLEQLTNILQHMECLSVLKVRLSSEMSYISLLQLISNVEDLTVYFREHHPNYWYLHMLHEWVVNKNAPKNLNLVGFLYHDTLMLSDSLLLGLIDIWPQWNADVPAGRVACLRLFMYVSMHLPLSLSYTSPLLQLQYGEGIHLPLVKATKFGLLGLREDLLLLTNCTYQSITVHKAKLVSLSVGDTLLNGSVTNLTFVTYFDVGREKYIHSGHLEQLAIACPNLMWLNLRYNMECLQSLQGLEVIARCCKKLQGLNLWYVPLRNIQSQVKLWDILSSMKLTQLGVELCTLKPLVERDANKLIRNFQKCSNLQGLEAYAAHECMDCGDIDDERPFLLSHFPSLEWCRLSSIQPQSAQEVITTCQGLKFFRCNCIQYLTLSLAHNSNLEQLCIGSEDTDLNITFLDTVSAHGELKHVLLSFNSVPSEGITILIENSPKLITCLIFMYTKVYDSQGTKVNLKGFKVTLKEKFPHRKLFTCGSLRLVQGNTILDNHFDDSDFIQFNSDDI